MAKTITIERALLDLTASFPSHNKSMNQRQIEIIHREMTGWTDDEVMYATQMYIKEGKFFPSVSELYTWVKVFSQKRIEGERNANSGDALAIRRQALEDAFYLEGYFDPEDWHELADLFTDAGRTEGAKSVLAKMVSIGA